MVDTSAAQSGPFSPGHVVRGRYEVRAPLGSGPIGHVYRAFDRDIEVEVSLKVIDPARVPDEQQKGRFLREAARAKLLLHPNVVRFFEADRDGAHCFVTTQLVEGVSLRKLVADRAEGASGPRFSLAELVPFATQLGAALAQADKLRFVIGSLRPENVLLLPDVLKITDASIMRAVGEEAYARAVSDAGRGFYLAPELRGRRTTPADGRADIYAFAVIVHELLAGTEFRGERVPLHRTYSDLPAALDDVIGRALSDDPAARPATAEELAADLVSIAKTGKPSGRSSKPPLVRPGSAAPAGVVAPAAPAKIPAPSRPASSPGTPSAAPPARPPSAAPAPRAAAPAAVPPRTPAPAPAPPARRTPPPDEERTARVHRAEELDAFGPIPEAAPSDATRRISEEELQDLRARSAGGTLRVDPDEMQERARELEDDDDGVLTGARTPPIDEDKTPAPAELPRAAAPAPPPGPAALPPRKMHPAATLLGISPPAAIRSVTSDAPPDSPAAPGPLASAPAPAQAPGPAHPAAAPPAAAAPLSPAALARGAGGNPLARTMLGAPAPALVTPAAAPPAARPAPATPPASVAQPPAAAPPAMAAPAGGPSTAPMGAVGRPAGPLPPAAAPPPAAGPGAMGRTLLGTAIPGVPPRDATPRPAAPVVSTPTPASPSLMATAPAPAPSAMAPVPVQAPPAAPPAPVQVPMTPPSAAAPPAPVTPASTLVGAAAPAPAPAAAPKPGSGLAAPSSLVMGTAPRRERIETPAATGLKPNPMAATMLQMPAPEVAPATAAMPPAAASPPPAAMPHAASSPPAASPPHATTPHGFGTGALDVTAPAPSASLPPPGRQTRPPAGRKSKVPAARAQRYRELARQTQPPPNLPPAAPTSFGSHVATKKGPGLPVIAAIVAAVIIVAVVVATGGLSSKEPAPKPGEGTGGAPAGELSPGDKSKSEAAAKEAAAKEAAAKEAAAKEAAAKEAAAKEAAAKEAAAKEAEKKPDKKKKGKKK